MRVLKELLNQNKVAVVEQTLNVYRAPLILNFKEKLRFTAHAAVVILSDDEDDITEISKSIETEFYKTDFNKFNREYPEGEEPERIEHISDVYTLEDLLAYHGTRGVSAVIYKANEAYDLYDFEEDYVDTEEIHKIHLSITIDLVFTDDPEKRPEYKKFYSIFNEFLQRDTSGDYQVVMSDDEDEDEETIHD